MARRNPLRSWLTAALSVMVVVALGLLSVRPGPAGAAERRIFDIKVTDAGFNPNVIPDANVNDVLMFTLDRTTDQHTVTFEDDSLCPGAAGAEPCWPDLRFDDRHANCWAGNIRLPGRRCMIIAEPGKTVQYHDDFNKANLGQITVLGQPTTTTSPPTTAPPTTTTTGQTTSTTQPSTTVTTGPQTTTSTAPTQIRPFVVADPSSTTSTMAPPVSVSTTSAAPAVTTAGKGKGKDDKAKSKSAGTETPTTVTPVAPDALPPGTVFDPSSLTPSPEATPVVPDAPRPDDVNLESSGILNLLDGVEEEGDPTNWGPLLLALGGLALVLSIGGICIWFGRPSRFDPA